MSANPMIPVDAIIVDELGRMVIDDEALLDEIRGAELSASASPEEEAGELANASFCNIMGGCSGVRQL